MDKRMFEKVSNIMQLGQILGKSRPPSGRKNGVIEPPIIKPFASLSHIFLESEFHG
jgi:hypothetical protein